MNACEFDALEAKITAHLSRLDPTTAEKLAVCLNTPHGNVRFALEELRMNEKSVTLLPFGLWDLSDEVPSVA
jgi:hypothetical protein